MKFYYDKSDDKVICSFKNSINIEGLEEIKANTVEASLEKHLSVIMQNGNEYEVKVGEVSHPMTEEHHIVFILLEFEDGYVIKYLDKEEEATMKCKREDNLLAAYCFCNLHGLWMTKQ